MKKRYAEARMSMILTKEDSSRISYKEDENGLTITVDVHGCSVKKAEWLVHNIIAVIHRIAFTLLVIHGYIHGTKILEMLRNEFESPRVVSICKYQENNGETMLSVAA